jgi:hypothetical protein
MRGRTRLSVNQGCIGSNHHLFRNRSSLKYNVGSGSGGRVNLNVIEQRFLETLSFNQDAVGNGIQRLHGEGPSIGSRYGHLLTGAEIGYRN